MKLRFTKMHGLGNDFIVIDAIHQSFEPSSEWIRRLAHRQFGVGFDQLLLVEKPTQAEVDFRYRIFNSDGSEVAQCGNGARCFVRFVHEKGLTSKPEIVVETRNGIIRPRLEADGSVTVDMGQPIFEPARIPFLAEQVAAVQPLILNGETLLVSVLSMGNPHMVQVVADVGNAPVLTQGPQLELHAQFPQRVNVGYMQVLDPHTIKLRVFERGSGETLACGSGACAAVVAGIRRNLLQSPVQVSTRGGNLSIAWAGENSPVLMTGPAETVFEGEIDL